ncbi:MAG TPA: hypothetical protein VEB20_07015 [Azospirillaceae bacterium]|nr:hypothetical protein [Azospirillaceae bacterium]
MVSKTGKHASAPDSSRAQPVPAAEEEDVLNGLHLAIVGRRRLILLLGEDEARRAALAQRVARNADMDGVLSMMVEASRDASVEHLVAAGARALLPSGAPDPGFDALVDLAADRLELAGAGVLVVEGAERLSADTLRDLAELSESASPSGRFLQILLAGSPALERRLEEAGLAAAVRSSGTVHRVPPPPRPAPPPQPARDPQTGREPTVVRQPQPSRPQAQAQVQLPNQTRMPAATARPVPPSALKAPPPQPPARSGGRSAALWLVGGTLLLAGAAGAYFYAYDGGQSFDRVAGRVTGGADVDAGPTVLPPPAPAAAPQADSDSPADEVAVAAPPSSRAPAPAPAVTQAPEMEPVSEPERAAAPDTTQEVPATAPAADPAAPESRIAGPVPPALPEETAAARAASAQPPAASQAELRTLLERARTQIAARQLTTPGPENALATLRRIEALSPGSPAAMGLRDEIVDTYLRWARLSEQRGEWANARVYYQRALRVEPQNRTVTDLLDGIEERQRRNQAARAQPARPRPPAEEETRTAAEEDSPTVPKLRP